MEVLEWCDLPCIEEVLQYQARLRIVLNRDLHGFEDFLGHGASEDWDLIFATDEVGSILQGVNEWLNSEAKIADLTSFYVEAFDVEEQCRVFL